MSDQPKSVNTPTDSDVKSEKERSENTAVEAVKTIGLSVVLALGIRTYIAEARYIPSESMLPTLEVNDRLIVEKLGYRFGPPKRGDVVVFEPTDELQDRDFKDAMIKRVIGLPGERVQLRDGRVLINGQPLTEAYIGDERHLTPSMVADKKARNMMPLTFESGEQRTEVNVCGLHEDPYLKGPIVVPEKSYLVLGDNRNRSYDSRCWGVVPEERIIGQAVWRFWPLDRLGGLD
ncbi:MAG: signal peptidase I [Cyanobacteria bacterium P01_D01_bin.73]